MAGTAVLKKMTEGPGSAVRFSQVQVNNLIDDLEKLRAAVQQAFLYEALGNPAFAILTNFDVQNANAIAYLNNGTLKTLAAAQTFDTGTAKTIATVKWGAAVLSLTSTGTPTLTWAAGDFTSEALALAALVSPGATHTILGAITVLAAGVTWTAGTDALAGGTGGTPATTTNYYNTINPNSLGLGTVDAAADLVAAKLLDVGDGLAIDL